MRIVSIVGARPQFVKMAAICRAVECLRDPFLEHRIIHSGQHYDAAMSDVFFQELRIPSPDHHLGVGSGSHGAQTGEMLQRIEPALLQEKPDWVLLYGDTNSTLAGAVVAAKLAYPTAHVEAGLRSYNRRMPEELNRIVADHLSDVLLCPTSAAMDNLQEEGLGNRSVLTGDVMLDAALFYRDETGKCGAETANIAKPDEFALATVHRAENTDDPRRLRQILSALDQIAERICPVLLPLHPRTRKSMALSGYSLRSVDILPPCSYLQMILLESQARFILTDSGGVQKEAYFFKVPCVTLRDETEWVETLANGCNVLAGADSRVIVQAVANCAAAGPWTAVYGDGKAALRVVETLRGWPKLGGDPGRLSPIS